MKRAETAQENKRKGKEASLVYGTCGIRLWLLRSRPDQIDHAAMRRGPPAAILTANMQRIPAFFTYLAWLHYYRNEKRQGLRLPFDHAAVINKRYKPSSRQIASTLAFTSSLIAIGLPHSRLVSPGHLLVASMPILLPRPLTGEAKSR